MPFDLLDLLARVGLDAVPRRTDHAAWQAAWDKLAYQPVGYSADMLDYQHTYLVGAGWALEDLSLVLLIDGIPCGLMPLTLGGPIGGRSLTSAGAAISSPIFSQDLPPRSIKKICSRLISFLRTLCAECALAAPILDDGPYVNEVGLSEWHQQLMAVGATPALRHDLFADLSPSLPQIRGSFRKSYRPLINVALRTWTVFEATAANADLDVWQEFKGLHAIAAGRSTRSDETWSSQFAMLSSNSAFLVGLRDPKTSRLVGAGFFQVTRDEGLYAVAAYDRTLFDKPLGHAVQQRAIEMMKERGLRWYRVGEQSYPQNMPAPTPKEMTISHFKQGFASHVYCRFRFSGLTSNTSS